MFYLKKKKKKVRMNKKKRERERGKLGKKGVWTQIFSSTLIALICTCCKRRGISCDQPRGQVGDNDIIFYLVSPSLKSVRKDNSQIKHTQRGGPKRKPCLKPPNLKCNVIWALGAATDTRDGHSTPRPPESNVPRGTQTLDLPKNRKGRIWNSSFSLFFASLTKT